MAEGKDNAGVIAPPPLIFLAAVLLGIGADALWPMGFGVERGLLIGAGAVVVAASVLLFVWSISTFRRAGTAVIPTEPSTVVVDTGPYRFSRNPIYLAFTLLTVGLALAFDAPAMLVFLVVAVLIVRYGVIAREEAYLERKFGDAYRAYKARIRRWM